MGSVVWAMVLDIEDVAREIYIYIYPRYTARYAKLVCKRRGGGKRWTDHSHDFALFHRFECFGDRVANFDACLLELFCGRSQTRIFFYT